MASRFREKVTELLLLSRGQGDNSYVFDILKRRANTFKVLQESLQLEMRFPAVKLSHFIELTGHGDFVLPGRLTRSSLQVTALE